MIGQRESPDGSVPEATHRVFREIGQRPAERQDQWAEVADVVPPVAVTPPLPLDRVSPTGRAEAGEGAGGRLAEQGVPAADLPYDDPATVPGDERFDPGQEWVGGRLHGRHLRDRSGDGRRGGNRAVSSTEVSGRVKPSGCRPTVVRWPRRSPRPRRRPNCTAPASGVVTSHISRSSIPFGIRHADQYLNGFAYRT